MTNSLKRMKVLTKTPKFFLRLKVLIKRPKFFLRLLDL